MKTRLLGAETDRRRGGIGLLLPHSIVKYYLAIGTASCGRSPDGRRRSSAVMRLVQIDDHRRVSVSLSKPPDQAVARGAAAE